MVDSKYNLIATVNHKPSKKNDGHYMAVNNSPTLGSWYKYDDNVINLVKFVKGNTNSILMNFHFFQAGKSQQPHLLQYITK
jgi:hypothetical protein